MHDDSRRHVHRQIQPETLREIETWEQQRQEKARKIQARRQAEQKNISNNKFPAGYGPHGRVPAYVQAHVSSLETSPLGRPVFSPGRGTRPVVRLSSPTPERRRYVRVAASANEGRHVQRKNGSIVKGRGLRPMTAVGGRCSVKMLPSGGSASSPLLVSTSSTTDCGLLRPATAPSVRAEMAPDAPKRLRQASPGRRYGRGLSASAKQEAQLVEKLASLSSVQRDGKFPTVAALKTAVAIEAVQAQLRECRDCWAGSGSNRPVSATAPIIRSNHQGQTGNVNTVRVFIPGRRRSKPGRRGGLEPWDNRSPFVANENLPCEPPINNKRPTSAPALRLLTYNDLMFGNSDACRRRHLSRSPSPHPANPTTPNREKEQGGTLYERELNNKIPCSSAANAAFKDMDTCFRQLTVGHLIELSHLRNPPEPVRAVLAAVACLLGWPWKPARQSPPPRFLFNSSAYVLRDILAKICPQRIPSRRLLALTKRLNAQEAALVRVQGANAAAGVLLKWLLAVVACARAEKEHEDAVGRRTAD